MTARRPGVITGVAKGGLGTGTALDDTQVYDLADLAPPEPVDPQPVAPQPARRATRSHRVAQARGAAQPRRVAQSPGTPRARGTATGRNARRVAMTATTARAAIPGPVWLAGGAAAAVLVFGLLGAVRGNPGPGAAGDGGLDGGSNSPAVVATPSIAPKEDGGGGNGKGNGRGGGNGDGDGDDD